MQIDHEKEELASRLRGSLLEFTRYFYQYITGREFIVSQPIGRESHHITVCRALTQVKRLELLREIINVPPGCGKSTFLCMFVAWCWAEYPDCNFLYISYGQELAAKHTAFIKSIVSSRMYGYLFDVHLDPTSRAKDSFKTTSGGSIKAFGSSGAITGQDAGLPGLNRMTGAVLLDDAHKPDEAHSDTIRESVIRNYDETIRQRPRGFNVPIISVGQCVHEADLTAYFMSGKDVDVWHRTVLKGLDEAGNALYPEMMPKEKLLALQEKSPYVFASQFQQDPVPAGGALFKPEWFITMDYEPKFLSTFITADTAETDKSWNDATVFSFWGVYEIETFGKSTGELGLHWIDCMELRIEPKDLKDAFVDFYANCTLHPMPPLMAAIEKKSTGVTLVNVLRDLRGMSVREIERTKASGSKTQRFLEIQPYAASKRISFTEYAKHKDMCITHMSKITANNSHRFDDICFVSGTKVATPFGEINIENIKIGDRIITPFGTGIVKKCGSTGVHNTIKKRNLTGTPGHPVYSQGKFIKLDTLSDAVNISPLNFLEILKWKYLKLLFLMESNIVLQERKDIILASQKIIKKGRVLKDFMWQFGNFLAEKKYQMALLFTIRMVIVITTTFKIWSVFHASNILKNMKNRKRFMLILNKIKNILEKLLKRQRNGIKALKDENGILKMRKPAFFSLKNISVKNAIKNMFVKHLVKVNFAASPTMLDGGEETFQSYPEIANGVENFMSQKNLPAKDNKDYIVPDPAQVTHPIKQEVFNLTVEPYGVYYANGILVSNCDTLSDAIRIALIEKTIYNVDNRMEAKKRLAQRMNQSLQQKIRAGAIRNARISESSS